MLFFYNSHWTGKHKARITDAVYLEYMKKMDEWEKKLQTFINKYKHLTTADPRVDTVHIIIEKLRKSIY